MYQLVTPFPFLLDFSFYAPLLLRLTLGIYMLAIGFSSYQNGVVTSASNEEEQQTNVAKTEMGANEAVYRGLFVLSGISLIIGAYAQIGAIVVVILMLASLFDVRARITSELSRAELSLLLVLALSIMVTGAGPFALDFPL